MKKVMLLLLLLLPMMEVKATNYYTDYSDFKEVTEIPCLESDLFEVRREKQYLWYRIKKEGVYLEKEEDSYPIATDFTKYGEWSNWSQEQPNDKELLEVQSRKVYHYQIRRPITLIRFSKISSEELEFENIRIYKNNRQISHQINKVDQDLILVLSEPCHVDELDIAFTLIDFTDLEKHYTIEWLYDLKLPSAMEVYTKHFFNGALDVSYRYRNMVENTTIWETEGNTLEKMESNIHQLVKVTEEYRFRPILRYYEREIKEYDNHYRVSGIGDYIYKDLSTEKEILQIRTRDKVLSVNSSEMKLESRELMEPSFKEELEQANATIVALKNEKSNQMIKPQTAQIIRKSSHHWCYIWNFIFFLLGVIVGRIVTMKKKF